MKKTVFALLAGAALLTACQPTTDKRARVDFELAEMSTDTILIGSYLVSDLGQRNLKLDTLLPGQTSYTFVAKTDTIPYNLIIVSADEMSKAIMLVALPGEQVKVKGNIKDWQVEGSDLNSANQQIQKTCRPYIEKIDSLSEIITEEINENEFLSLWRQIDSIKVDYIRQHPDEDLSLYLLSDVGGKYVEELYPTLSDKVKKGVLAPIAQAIEKGMKQEMIFKENKKKIAEGAEAPDFTLKDLNGQDLALSSLRGKYVVLDFWGSWCGWCIKGIPDMKKYYEKYKGKMEILGIDCRDTEEKWKAAVEKYELPWLHVRNEGNPDVSLLYAVQGYPTKIVVDPDGKIAKVMIGEDPAFYEYLDKLFK